MFSGEALIVVQSLFEMRGDTDHIPVVSYFARTKRILYVQTNRATAQLFDRHRRSRGRQIDQCVQRLAIPAFTKYSPRTDEALRDPALQQLRSHSYVQPRFPFGTSCGDFDEQFVLIVGDNNVVV